MAAPPIKADDEALRELAALVRTPRPPRLPELDQATQQELDRVTAAALTRLSLVRGGPTCEARFFPMYAATAAHCSGVPLEAHLPELASRGWRNRMTAMNRRGLTVGDLQRAFADLSVRYGVLTTFERALLTDLFDEGVWRGVQAMILDGPQAAVARGEATLRRIIDEGPLFANRRRHGNTVAKSTIDNHRNLFMRVGRLLFSLRSDGFPSPILEAWDSAPRLPVIHMAPGGVEVVAPPWHRVRHAWHQINGEVWSRLGVADFQAEAAAIASLSNRQILDMGLYRLLRKRAILMLLIVVGARRDALVRLTRDDVQPHRVGHPPDYREGPAIALEPRKGLADGHVRVKPLPEDAYAVLQSLWSLADRYRALKVPGFQPRADEPILLPRLMWHGEPVTRALDADRLEDIVGGEAPKPAYGSAGTRPIVVRESGLRPDTPAEERPYHGYQPHEFRHGAYQWAMSAAELHMAEHPAGPGETTDPRHYAEALLDHRDTTLAAVYGDRNVESVIELLSGRASTGLWRMLTTDIGGRRRPDRAAIERLNARRRAVESDIEQLGRKAVDYVGQEIVRRPFVLPRPPAALPAGASVNDQLTRLTEISHVLSEQNHALHAAAEDLRRITLGLHGVAIEMQRLHHDHAPLVTELNRLRFDQTTWETLPDDAPPGAERITAELEREIFGPNLLPETTTVPAVRDWLTLAEFARLAGVGVSTVHRWRQGASTPRGVRPWDPDFPPPFDGADDEPQRVWVPAITPEFWRTPLIRRALEETLAEWPEGKGWSTNGLPSSRSLAPLVLPEPYAARYAELHRSVGD